MLEMTRISQPANPDNSPHSWCLARYSLDPLQVESILLARIWAPEESIQPEVGLSQRFRLPHKYREYSLGHRKRCDNDYLHFATLRGQACTAAATWTSVHSASQRYNRGRDPLAQ